MRILIDENPAFQQNATQFRIAVVVLEAPAFNCIIRFR